MPLGPLAVGADPVLAAVGDPEQGVLGEELPDSLGASDGEVRLLDGGRHVRTLGDGLVWPAILVAAAQVLEDPLQEPLELAARVAPRRILDQGLTDAVGAIPATLEVAHAPHGVARDLLADLVELASLGPLLDPLLELRDRAGPVPQDLARLAAREVLAHSHEELVARRPLETNFLRRGAEGAEPAPALVDELIAPVLAEALSEHLQPAPPRPMGRGLLELLNRVELVLTPLKIRAVEEVGHDLLEEARLLGGLPPSLWVVQEPRLDPRRGGV